MKRWTRIEYFSLPTAHLKTYNLHFNGSSLLLTVYEFIVICRLNEQRPMDIVSCIITQVVEHKQATRLLWNHIGYCADLDEGVELKISNYIWFICFLIVQRKHELTKPTLMTPLWRRIKCQRVCVCRKMRCAC